MWNITVDTFMSKPEECLTYIEANWDKIPMLDCVLSNKLCDGQIVKFCGMIQDMPNPVYYFSSFEVLNKITGLKEVRSGKFLDSLHCKEDEELILDSEKCQNQERQLYCCISIPALNSWAHPKNIDTKIYENPPSASKKKRNAEDMEVEDHENLERNKRLCTNLPSSVSHERSQLGQQTFPISSPHNYSCVVHIYDALESHLKVNDIIEICGFVHFTPVSQGSDLPLIDVPRLHAVTVSTVKSFNPFCRINIKKDEILLEATKLRSELQLVLTQMLLGDSLAADYLICHLIAHVYARFDCTVLGKFSVNMSNVPVRNDYIMQLYTLISNLLPKTHYIPLSLSMMNSTDMLPKKNYDIDRLQAGMLQLSDHTHLVIDETKLEVGKLEEKGVKNIQALKCLIENQKLDYDFKFFTVEFITDIPVLILSEGKSLLPSDCHIVLNPEAAYMSSLEDCYLAVSKYLEEPLLDKIRDYLAAAASISEFILPDHLHQTVEHDLVEQRQAGEKTSADDFHARLVLARLLSLSYGEKELTKITWDKTGNMERERKLRLNIQNKYLFEIFILLIDKYIMDKLHLF